MKFTFTFLAVLATACTLNAKNIPEFGEGELYNDFQAFLKLFPYNEAVTIVLQYAEEDEEFQAAIEYAQSDAFKQLVVDVESLSEIKRLMEYLDKTGIDIYMIVNKLNELLDIDLKVPLSYKKGLQPRITGGLRGLVDDIMAIVPVDKIKELYYYKLEHSKVFANFIMQLKSPEFQKIVNTVYANPTFQELLHKAKSAGLDLSIIKELLFRVLGIEVPSSYGLYIDNELEKDFMDFFALIPIEEVVEIVTVYYAEDEEIKKAIEYALSDEFKDMVRAVEALKEYQELVIYLTNAGVNVVQYIQNFHEMIGMEDYISPVPTNFANYKATGGIRGMIDDIKELLPIKDIKALYHEKLETSQAFAKFIQYIQSENMQKIVNSLYSHQVYLDMLNSAKQAGLDLQAIGEFFHSLFGLEFPEH